MPLLGSEDAGLGSIHTAAGDDSPASGGGGAKTLAALYAYGLGDDPAADNVFVEPAGNMRWALPDSVGTPYTFPNAAWFENEDLGEPRVGAWVTWRRVSASTGLPATTERSFVLYDPAFGGTGSAPVDDDEWVTARGQMTNDPSQDVLNNAVDFWRESYQGFNFYGRLPNSIPAPGLVVGQGEDFRRYMWSEGFDLQIVEYFSSWGQRAAMLNPRSAGITPVEIGMWSTDGGVADGAGNGTGYAISAGRHGVRDDAQNWRGLFSSAMVGADHNGDWYSSVWAYDSAGAGLTETLKVFWDHAEINGATISTLDDAGLPVEMLETAEIDLTAPGPTLLVPARPGKIFLASRLLAHVTAVAGTLSTNPTISVDHILAPSSVLFNSVQFAFGAPSQTSSTIAAGAMPANTDLFANVTAAATGVGLVYKVKLAMIGSYVNA